MARTSLSGFPEWLPEGRIIEMHVLDELRRFARRRPATFLIGAAIAGVVVGRLTRNLLADQER